MAARTQTTAILFPGQGSHTAEMGAVAAAHRPDLLELMRAELEADPFERISESTAFAQPAIYCASLAHWERAGRPVGEMTAGHSLGELAALVAGGALDEREGLRLAVARGRLMEEAAAASPGAMLAVLGDSEAATEVAARCGLAIANDNAPGQLVLSGAADAVGEARKALRAEGVKSIRLPVAGAFHSPLMTDAAARLREVLDRVELVEPRVPVYSSISARPFEDARAELTAALTQPVLWTETLRRMRAAGAARFLEVGPGEVLTGLVRRTLPHVEARSLAAEEAAHA